MNNVYILAKLFFKNNFSANTKRKSKSKSRKAITLLIIVFGIYAVINAIIKGVSFVYPILQNIGSEEMLISLPIRAVNILLFFYSTISVLSYFYSEEDIQLILPLPVKPYEIISSKLIITSINQYLIAATILIPLLISYGVLSHATVIYYITAILVVLLSPILPLIFNLMLIMTLMSFSVLYKNKEQFKTIIFGLIMITTLSYSFFRQFLTSTFGNSESLSSVANTYNNWAFVKITNIFYTIKFQINSLVYNGSSKGYISLIVFLILTLASYFVLSLIAEKVYLKGVVGLEDVFSKTRENSVLKSYFLKEMRMLFRTPSFAYNCIFQNLIFIVFIIISMFKGFSILSKSEFGKMITLNNPITTYLIIGSIVGIVVVTSLNNIAPTSITREGKNAYVMKYLAIDYKTQFFAKALVAVVFNLIYLIIFVVLAISINLSPTIIVLISILILIVSLFTSLTGVVVDLNRPKLNWENDTQAVKQNLNPVINLFLNIVIAYFIYALFIAKLPAVITFAVIFIVYVMLIIVVFKYINRNADILFKQIN